ncbi:EndoU domain-containing protein [Patescibacteria group bacterium]|nr:EndoU domain-containing protein [Patescibacteria group bacterium]MBU1721396.1 EndoU domain-containing protein [Patescibacteria group bacterium]MBU1901836.1 EndoU domain-containing protein [Patescibacteria group bacterium]
MDDASPADLEKVVNDTLFTQRLIEDDVFYEFNNNSRDFGRYNHEFKGDASGGWHYLHTGRSGNRITNKVVGNNGVYKADVEYYDEFGNLHTKSDNSFFPDSWSEKDVLEAINDAYINRGNPISTSHPFNNVHEVNRGGIDIRIIVEKNTNRFVSAFPIRDPGFNGF